MLRKKKMLDRDAGRRDAVIAQLETVLGHLRELHSTEQVLAAYGWAFFCRS